MGKEYSGIIRAKLDIGHYRQMLKAASEIAMQTKDPDLFFALDERIMRGRDSASRAETVIAKLIEVKNEQFRQQEKRRRF